MGCKPKFDDPDKMRAMIEEYFADCEGEMLMDSDTGKPLLDKWGHPVIVGAHPPTVTGLARALGFKERKSLLHYQGKKDFKDIITDAKLRIEAYAEERLYDRDGANGARFVLEHNFRWRDDETKNNEGATPTVRIICDIPPARVEPDGPTQPGADGPTTNEASDGSSQ